MRRQHSGAGGVRRGAPGNPVRPVTPPRPVTSSGARPVGFTPGTPALLGAWLVGLAVVRLTGAAAVVLLLVATAVAMAFSMLAGWRRLRAVDICGVVAPTITTTGDEITLVIDHRDARPSSAATAVRVFGVDHRLDERAPTSVTVNAPAPGVVETIHITTASAGAGGLVRWRRRHRIDIDRLHVAPHAVGPILPVVHTPSSHDGSSAPGVGPRVGELDGARPWRPGEGERAIHWPSTLRAGELIAHDRSASSEANWTVSINSDAGRLRWTLEDGLRRGHAVHVSDLERVGCASDADDRHSVHTNHDAMRWAAIAASRSAGPTTSTTAPWWRRQISLAARSGRDERVALRGRMLTAAASLLALWMLLGALSSGFAERALAALGIAVGTAVSLRYPDGRRPWWIRFAVIAIAVAALIRIAIQTSGIGGLLAALRGPMPELLMLLVVLHGAEISDRRTNRVHLAIGGVVVAYAAGLRIDGSVGWWMFSWGVLAIGAFCSLDRQHRPANRPGAFGRVAMWGVAGAACTMALGAFVPVPAGPASLGLPALSGDGARVDGDGALVGPDGTPIEPNSTGDPSRGALGQAGGYPGFSDTLDTAVRGDLGDEIVMRVRAPEPAFWRGQTFTAFDGRVWRIADVDGVRIAGPEIALEPTIGDLPTRGTATEEFVQTYHVEADLPNVVFAAATARTVIFDGDVFARPDGALRADRTLAAGTVYSVVSERVPVTAATLRSQGDIAEVFAEAAGHPQIAPFLEIPDSTTTETVQLAADLRVAGSTYDTIRAYEAWMAVNTQYDLDAPVPDGDAVDDFLFRSQRGFCEQIASSLVVMLRSQGVPARLATGFIPGSRNQISGVFEVRASDAHAWVEVWFPETGWEPFDPTASVPLAGDAERTTVGADTAAAIVNGIAAHPVEIGAVLAAIGLALGTIRVLAAERRRRARGTWGLLHDRFMALAPGEVTAPRVAARLVEELGQDTFGPDEVAAALDRVVFDPDYEPDDDIARRVTADITSLERELTASRSR